ncbi:MAG TPA: LLM class flavin-dependent oxidoreductase, partial [Dehalococcoidia bacterium]|nr:LLM class flavin-dependent oxidoreductase [Dehalococcoidia bacterium]
MEKTQYYYFTEQPYIGYDPAVQEQHPSLRLTLPNKLFDPVLGSELYNRYHAEYEVADQVGFDGIMINEHHTAPFCMQASINITGAVLAKITDRVKIVMLGNPLPIVDNPLRLAEELAMIDMISRGRLVSGFVRGGGVESLANNVNPVYNRERFEEAHDLILAAWTRPGPFSWYGKHFQYRVVNPWALPLQKPHPPIMVPGTASPETVVWAAKHRYPYVVLGSSLEQTQELIAIYRETAQQEGYEMGREHVGYLIRVFVADTEEKAQELGYNFFWQKGALTKQIREWLAPPGYASIDFAGVRRT